MPIVKISAIPGAGYDIVNVNEGETIFQVIENNNLFDYKFTLNGQALPESFDISYTLNGDDILCAYGQPKGFIEGAIALGIAFVAAFAATKLMPKPAIPQDAGKSKESPNNQLNGQRNIARLYQARPETFGTVVSYPDLMNQALFEYVGNDKIVTQCFNIGIGFYQWGAVKYSESPVSLLNSSQARIYNPGEVIPLIIDGFQFDDVDGRQLSGIDDAVRANEAVAYSYQVVFNPENPRFKLTFRLPRSATGMDYYLGLMPIPFQPTMSIFIEWRNKRTGEIKTYTFQHLESVYAYPDRYDINIYNRGAFEFPYEFMNSTNVNAYVDLTYFRMFGRSTYGGTGPFFSPIAADEFWLHFQADLGAGRGTSLYFLYDKVDDNGNAIPGTQTRINVGFAAPSEFRTVFQTVKLWAAHGYGKYKFYFYWSDESSPEKRVRLDMIHCITRRYNVVYPEDTILITELWASTTAMVSRESKINVEITRKTISYNRATKQIDNNLRASRSFADAVLHSWVVSGKQDPARLDIEKLYQIYDSITDSKLKEFCYTFDDEDISLGQRIETICNCCRVGSFWSDRVLLSFVRDEPRQYAEMLFGAGNVKSGSYQTSFDVRLPSGFDGIDLQYVDPVTNKYDNIWLTISGEMIYSGKSAKPMKIELAGCRNKRQAFDRAMLEAKRMIYERVNQKITAFRDGESVAIGQLVKFADFYNTNMQTGVIKSVKNNVFTTEDYIEFTGSMYVSFSQINGNPSNPVRAFPRNDGRPGFIADFDASLLPIWGENGTQSPSRYLIAESVEHDRSLWIVTERTPRENGETDLVMVEHDPKIYEYSNPY